MAQQNDQKIAPDAENTSIEPSEKTEDTSNLTEDNPDNITETDDLNEIRAADDLDEPDPESDDLDVTDAEYDKSTDVDTEADHPEIGMDNKPEQYLK